MSKAGSAVVDSSVAVSGQSVHGVMDLEHQNVGGAQHAKAQAREHAQEPS